MRMRKKRNLIPRMERCSRVQIKNPEDYRGVWMQAYPDIDGIHLELGCGKGRFTVGVAEQNPKMLLVAIEKVADAMVVGMERVCERGLENVRFVDCDAVGIEEIFEPGEVSRIYINFCDPWPRSRDAKRRLTSPGFLRMYRELLPPDGEIHFKTDNLPLFEYSLEQFQTCGFELRDLTFDLHEKGPVGIMTDYEAKFHEQGVKINRCVASVPKQYDRNEEEQ